MVEHRTILLDRLRKVFVEDGRGESLNPSGSESFPIFFSFEGEIFALTIPANIFYRSYEKLLGVSHDRRITFQGKPVTDLELKVFQTAIDESMQFVRVAEGQIRRFEWPSKAGRSSNDSFQLSLGLSAKSIDFKQPDLSSFGSRSPSELAKTLCWEHPRSIALVLSQLDISAAVDVLEELPAELRAELAFDLVDFRDGRNQNLLKRIKLTEFLNS